MGAETAISWADATFNIAIGCQKVSEACAHCYAERDMENPRYGARFRGAWGPAETAKRYTLSDTYWKQPAAWQRKAAGEGRRLRVFCSSLCDVFEDHPVLEEQRTRLWPVIAATPSLDWLLLTKRAEHAARVWPWASLREAPSNVWLGVSVEDQATADERIPLLLQTPAAVRWISAEPLLGPVDLRHLDILPRLREQFSRFVASQGGDADKEARQIVGPAWVDSLTGDFSDGEDCGKDQGLDWIVAGGESGPHARPMHPDWVRGLRDQCQTAGVPFFFKQWGEWAPTIHAGRITNNETGETAALRDGGPMVRVGRKQAGRELDGRTWDEVPALPAERMWG